MYRKTLGEKVFDVALIIFFIILSVIMVFPFYNVVMNSLVSRGEYFSRAIILWPNELYLTSYAFIFSSEKLMRSLLITAFITVVGTIYSMFITVMLSYGLSKRYFPGRKILLTLIMITMFFGGGLIPYYLLIRNLKLINNVWVMILPAGVSTWNFLVIRSFFHQLPTSLEESAKLDGANDFQVLWSIVLPISLPVLATFSLFYGVDYWNTWWSAQLFITDQNLHPLQLVLRRMVVMNELPSEMQVGFNTTTGGRKDLYEDGIRMATVVVATVPILCLYPFLQKYFVKGVLIGSIKG